MKNASYGRSIGMSISSVPECLSPVLHSSTSYCSSQSKKNRVDSVFVWMSKFSKKASNYSQSIREHVSLGPKVSETVKGKLSMGTRILQAGGIERVFRRNFSVEKGEKLLKAFQCYLSTTAGPISGLLFISTQKIAFHSDTCIVLTSPKGNLAKVPYKVIVPLRRIKRVHATENANKPSQKYIQVVTVDGFEFWFMGFLRYQRSFKHLQQAISEPQVVFQ